MACIRKHLVEVPAWLVILAQVNHSNPTIKRIFAGLII
jgi:hypothetical protein